MAGRGQFGSRIGFVMAAVGSAVGLGNLWRFPQLVSQNGGLAFVMLYLVLLFAIGLPALMAELSIGRNQGKNAVQAFGPDKQGRQYAWVGFLFLFTAVLLLSYYSVIAGSAIRYFFGSFTAPYFDDPAAYYASIDTGPGAILFHVAFMAITLLILVRGVNKGIEKANLIMMPMLFLSVILIAIYGNFFAGDAAGRAAGREFYIFNAECLQAPLCDALRINSFSQGASLLGGAAGQTFFSIGLGLGTMLTYSSYIGRDADLQRTGITIGFADTAVAVVAGFMVFPLLFGLGLGELSTEGDGLFVALPAAFAEIGGTLGGVFAGIFFLLLVFAALSSALSLLEVPVSYVVDRYPEVGRRRAVLLLGGITYILGVPSAIWGQFLGFADGLVTPLLLLGGLLLTLYVGWLKPEIMEELRVGAKRDWTPFWSTTIKYPLPVFLSILLLLSVVAFFQGLF